MSKLQKDTGAIEQREYQIEDLANIEKEFETHRSVLYQLPTGGGKSVVAMEFIKPRKTKNILILAHKKKLLKQMHNRLPSIGVKKIGTLWGGKAENMEANICVVSIRSAVKEGRIAELMKRDWDLVIVDEARHTRTTSYDNFLIRIETEKPKCKLFGMDATPYRKDKKPLAKHFEVMVVSKATVKSLTEQGYLQACKLIQIPFDKEALKEHVKEVANDYQQTELSNYMRQDKFLDYVVNMYKDYGEERQAIVFAVDKAHARDIRDKFVKNGYTKVVQIDSDMSDEYIDKAYADFESKKVQILINIEMATEGVDLPICSCIVAARPTKSLTLYLQMAGRGTRPDGIHEYFIMIDCCGWNDEFGSISADRHWSLNPDIDPNNPAKKNKQVGVRADGTLVEDITNFIGEVIELTPEEYMTRLSGGLEAAKEHNRSVDAKIKTLEDELQKLMESVISKDTDPAQFCWKPVLSQYGGKGHVEMVTINNKEEENWQNFHHCILSLDKERYFMEVAQPDFENYYRGDSLKSTLNEYMILTQGAGDVNKTLLDDKRGERYTTKLLRLWEQMMDLEATKIDLRKFERAAETARQEEWDKAVKENAAATGEFLFKKELSLTGCFPKDGGYRDQIIGITIPSKGINNYHNKINLIVRGYWDSEKTRIVEKNYVKGEKVIEMIKDSGWGAEILEPSEEERKMKDELDQQRRQRSQASRGRLGSGRRY